MPLAHLAHRACSCLSRVSATHQIQGLTAANQFDEACQFPEPARRDRDVLNTAYVLVLVLGLQGELLGLAWKLVGSTVPSSAPEGHGPGRAGSRHNVRLVPGTMNLARNVPAKARGMMRTPRSKR